MKTTFRRFLNNEQGATAIEYGLLVALVGIGIVVGAKTLGTNLNDSFVHTKDQFPT